MLMFFFSSLSSQRICGLHLDYVLTLSSEISFSRRKLARTKRNSTWLANRPSDTLLFSKKTLVSLVAKERKFARFCLISRKTDVQHETNERTNERQQFVSPRKSRISIRMAGHEDETRRFSKWPKPRLIRRVLHSPLIDAFSPSSYMNAPFLLSARLYVSVRVFFFFNRVRFVRWVSL